MFKGWTKIIKAVFPPEQRSLTETIHYKDKVSITEKTLNDLISNQRKLEESIRGALLKLSESHLGRRVDISEHLWQQLPNEEMGESVKRRYGLLEDLINYIERHGKANVYDNEVPAFESVHIPQEEMQIIKLKKELLRRAAENGLATKIKIPELVWSGQSQISREDVLKNIEAFTQRYAGERIMDVPMFDLNTNYISADVSSIESAGIESKPVAIELRIEQKHPHACELARLMDIDPSKLGTAQELMTEMESRARTMGAGGTLPYGFVADSIEEIRKIYPDKEPRQHAEIFLSAVNHLYKEESIKKVKAGLVAMVRDKKKAADIERAEVERARAVEERKPAEKPRGRIR